MLTRLRLRLVLPFLVVIAAGGYLTFSLVQRSSTSPAWKRYLASLPEREINPAWQSSLEHQRERAHLRNEIEKKITWISQDAMDLIEYVQRVPLDARSIRDDTAKQEAERYFLAQDILVAVTERIRVGAPIEHDAMVMLIDMMLKRSYSGNPSIRHGLANGLCASGLILSDRRIHDRVVELIDDPDPEVAMNARRHYTWHTATPEAQEKLRKIGATRWEQSRSKRGGGG